MEYQGLKKLIIIIIIINNDNTYGAVIMAQLHPVQHK